MTFHRYFESMYMKKTCTYISYSMYLGLKDDINIVPLVFVVLIATEIDWI